MIGTADDIQTLIKLEVRLVDLFGLDGGYVPNGYKNTFSNRENVFFKLLLVMISLART